MAYSYQTFSVGQVLTAAQVQQLEVNVRDHAHGSDGVSALPYATQTQMEAATSLVTVASPGNAQWHPGVAKAWSKMSTSGGTVSNDASRNISSITDNGVGDFTFNFTTSFSSANYAMGHVVDLTLNSANGGRTVQIVSLATGAARLTCSDTSAGALDDPAYMSVIFMGDQ